jgi:exodeoxyribonuclease VII small subunit
MDGVLPQQELPDLALGELTFEQAYARLEEVVAELESAELPLDRAVELYELGTRLVRYASARLDSAELRIGQLMPSADGELGVGAAEFDL